MTAAADVLFYRHGYNKPRRDELAPAADPHGRRARGSRGSCRLDCRSEPSLNYLGDRTGSKFTAFRLVTEGLPACPDAAGADAS